MAWMHAGIAIAAMLCLPITVKPAHAEGVLAAGSRAATPPWDPTEVADLQRSAPPGPDDTSPSNLAGRSRQVEAVWGGMAVLPDPFLEAKWFPPDTRGFVALVGASDLLDDFRREGTIETGLATWYELSEAGRAWRELAARFGMTDAELLSDVFGRRVIIALPGDCADAATTSLQPRELEENPLAWAAGDCWVIVAETQREVLTHLVTRLGLRLSTRSGEPAVYTSPDGRLHMAYGRDRLLIAGDDARDWIDPLLQGVEPSPSLADTAEFREARLLGRGQGVAFFRDRIDPVGGAAATGPVRPADTSNSTEPALRPPPTADNLESRPRWWAAVLRHNIFWEASSISTLGRYDAAYVTAFNAEPRLHRDALGFTRFRDGELIMSVVNRFTPNLEQTPDQVARMFTLLLRTRPDLTESLGPVTMTLLLDRTGRDPGSAPVLSDVPSQDVRLAEMVWAISIEPTNEDRQRELEIELDLLVLNALRGAELVSGGRFQLDLPNPLATDGGSPPTDAVRSVNLQPMFRGLDLAALLPADGAMELSWTLAREPETNRAWWLVATSRAAAERAAEVIAAGRPQFAQGWPPPGGPWAMPPRGPSGSEDASADADDVKGAGALGAEHDEEPKSTTGRRGDRPLMPPSFPPWPAMRRDGLLPWPLNPADENGLVTAGVLRGPLGAYLLRSFPGVFANNKGSSYHSQLYTFAAALHSADRVYWKVNVTSPVSIESEIVIKWAAPIKQERLHRLHRPPTTDDVDG